MFNFWKKLDPHFRNCFVIPVSLFILASIILYCVHGVPIEVKTTQYYFCGQKVLEVKTFTHNVSTKELK